MIKNIIQIILTLLVLAAGLLIGRHLMTTAPEAKRQPVKRPIPVVEVQQFQPQDYTVKLSSRGSITARTQSTLIPQVSGQVVKMGENFRDGGLIKKGEMLLEIERADYELALTIAKSDLASARLTLQEERAQAKQAKSDWEKLGMAGTPDDLVLRKPQLAKVHAAVASASARVEQAELNLSRTRILAPYDGQILSKQVDIGQVVSQGTQLASLYATDIAEVRLPLTDKQLGMLDVSALQRENEAAKRSENISKRPIVTLTSQFGNRTWRWQGEVVRTEGTFDTRSRQLSVIAQIQNPFISETERPALKIGQFVTAEIAGRTLKQVYVLPRQVVSGDDTVLIMDAEDTVQRREIPILWQTADIMVTSGAISATDRLITTPLPYSLQGMPVQTDTQARAANLATKNSKAGEQVDDPKPDSGAP